MSLSCTPDNQTQRSGFLENTGSSDGRSSTTAAGMTLTWDTPINSNISSYKFYVKAPKADKYQLYKDVDVNRARNFNLEYPSLIIDQVNLENLVAGKSFCFKLQALNEAGSSAMSKEVCGHL